MTNALHGSNLCEILTVAPSGYVWKGSPSNGHGKCKRQNSDRNKINGKITGNLCYAVNLIIKINKYDQFCWNECKQMTRTHTHTGGTKPINYFRQLYCLSNILLQSQYSFRRTCIFIETNKFRILNHSRYEITIKKISIERSSSMNYLAFFLSRCLD